MQSFIDQWLPIFYEAIKDTFLMVAISLAFSVLIGIILAIILILTRPGQPLQNKFVYQFFNLLINVIRSIPFIILLFFMLPFTKFIVGTSIGVEGAIVPLVVNAAPYIARLIESSLLEVNQGVIEAYRAMGIKTHQIIWNVMLREARPAIVLALTIATISLIGATAMAGLVGAGGLGDLAYRFGHLRYETDVMYVTVILLIIIVQGIQSIGNRLAARMKKD
ncbi:MULTISPECIES: methionine ABC transporter permease [Oceanobacillus]|uniref:ABC transporter permease n=1 Tax=Oceanobacillus neutriphilus TaxID=531815 RepID=A0ABQ2NXK0_9BACI|nr:MULTISPECIES: methionine ABC transporter permease [Oceanobacillus]MCT1902621.1 ABC transporter permease [Oceanobacillus sojae]GGP13075.1 ABC transporter permease [Oceanobacillus neutriphilus]